MVQWFLSPIGTSNSLHSRGVKPGLRRWFCPKAHGRGSTLKLFVSLLLVILMLAANAAEKRIYKTVDAEGNTVFTDHPPKEGRTEELTVQTPNVFAIDEAIPGLRNDQPSADSDASSDDEPMLYRTLRIVSPAHNESIRGNHGSVRVGVVVDPGLIHGHKLRLLLDGVRHLEGASTSFTLNNLDRGEHTLQVDIVYASGQVLQSSEPSIFHLQRYSQLTAPNQDQSTPLPKVVNPPKARSRSN